MMHIDPQAHCPYPTSMYGGFTVIINTLGLKNAEEPGRCAIVGDQLPAMRGCWRGAWFNLKKSDNTMSTIPYICPL